MVRQPASELPAPQGEVGLAGICLDPTRGFVFATYAYRDGGGVLRNGLTRFSATPGTFSTESMGRTDLSSVFADDISHTSHQIGPCQVDGDALYVSVGNGQDVPAGRRRESTLGKLLRMTVDGEPYPGNPFPKGAPGHADYVWALGLRNAFSLRVVDHRVFVGDNGPAVDRLMEVRAGEDYRFDGTDWSIGVNADMVFAPAVSPVGLDFQDSVAEGLGAGYDRAFFLALAGALAAQGRSQIGARSVVTFSYDFERNRIREAPKLLVQYKGEGVQIVVAVGVGPDGIYFVPMLPDASGMSAVFRLTATAPPPHVFVAEGDGAALVQKFTCLGCHSIGSNGGKSAPPLDRQALLDSISARLSSTAYRARIADRAPDGRAAIDRVLALSGEERVRAWMIEHIRAPDFDNSDAGMPNLGVTEAEATVLANYLLSDSRPSLRQRIVDRGTLVLKSQRTGLAAGAMAGFAVAIAVGFAWRRLRRTRSGPA
jgi:glucose/arabinose dehydrogenase